LVELLPEWMGRRCRGKKARRSVLKTLNPEKAVYRDLTDRLELTDTIAKPGVARRGMSRALASSKKPRATTPWR